MSFTTLGQISFISTMKVFIFSLAIVTATTCNIVNGIEVDSKNEVSKPLFSRANQDLFKPEDDVGPVIYKSQQYTVEPTVTYKPPTDSSSDLDSSRALEPEDYKKPIALTAPLPNSFKPTPLFRRVVENGTPIPYRTETYSVPRNVVRTYSSQFNRGARQFSDSETDVVEYPIEDLPPVPISIPRGVPITIYTPYPPTAIRRRYRVPAFRRPNYSRAVNVGSYNTLEYDDPLAYPVRTVTYGYPSTTSGVRIVPSNVVLENVAPADSSRYIDVEYDELLKKK